MFVMGMANSDFLDTLAGVGQDMMAVVDHDMMVVAVQGMLAAVGQDMAVAVNHTEVVQDMVDSRFHLGVVVRDLEDILADLVGTQGTAQNPSTQKKNILRLYAIKHKTKFE